MLALLFRDKLPLFLVYTSVIVIVPLTLQGCGKDQKKKRRTPTTYHIVGILTFNNLLLSRFLSLKTIKTKSSSPDNNSAGKDKEKPERFSTDTPLSGHKMAQLL